MTDETESRDRVRIERSFDVPVDLIWKMWTDPELFKAWYGPEGASIPVAKMDVRVGGSRLVAMEMQSPESPMQMWFAGEYREVVDNKRLVYTEFMSDEHGNMSSPSNMGMPAGHPMTTEVLVELEDVGGRTKGRAGVAECVRPQPNPDRTKSCRLVYRRAERHSGTARRNRSSSSPSSGSTEVFVRHTRL